MAPSYKLYLLLTLTFTFEFFFESLFSSIPSIPFIIELPAIRMVFTSQGGDSLGVAYWPWCTSNVLVSSGIELQILVAALKQITVKLLKPSFMWCLLLLYLLPCSLSYSTYNSFKISSISIQVDDCSIWTDDRNSESHK